MAGRKLYVAAPWTSNATLKVACVNGTKTILQVATPSTTDISVIAWWVTLDASAAATPVIAELVQTDVAATVTSLTPQAYNDANAPASLCVGGTSATGYNASAEGTITATRVFDTKQVPPTGGLERPWAISEEPSIPVSKFLRIRINSTVIYNVVCGIIFQE